MCVWVWVWVYLFIYLFHNLHYLFICLFVYLFIYRGDAASGRKRKGMKYLDEAKVSVSGKK